MRFESHKQVDVTGTRETKSVERRPKKKKKSKERMVFKCTKSLKRQGRMGPKHREGLSFCRSPFIL